MLYRATILLDSPDATIEIPSVLERGGIVAFAGVALWWFARWMSRRAEVEDARQERTLALFEKRMEIDREQRDADRKMIAEPLRQAIENLTKHIDNFQGVRDAVYSHHADHARKLDAIGKGVDKLLEGRHERT